MAELPCYKCSTPRSVLEKRHRPGLARLHPRTTQFTRGRNQGGLKRGARTVQALHSLALVALVALAFYLGWALMTPDDRQLLPAVRAHLTVTELSHTEPLRPETR